MTQIKLMLTDENCLCKSAKSRLSVLKKNANDIG